MSFALIASIVGTAAVFGGVAAGGMALYGSGQEAKKQKGEAEQKARVQQERLKELNKPVAAPTPEDAQGRAREAEQKRRRMRALSGGKTLLSSEKPKLGGGGATLLGG